MLLTAWRDTPPRCSPRALAATGGAGTKASRGAQAGTTPSHPAPHVRSSPLVTTITTIADVVPLPIRFLLGLLLSLSLALGTRSWLAAMRTRRLERQRGELLEDVGLLQAALLPETPKHLGVVSTSAAYRPADGPGAGGDFYDVFALGDGRVAVILATSPATAARRAAHRARALHPARLHRRQVSPRAPRCRRRRACWSASSADRSRPWWWPPTTRMSAPWCTPALATRRRWWSARPRRREGLRSSRSRRSPSAPRRRSARGCAPDRAKPPSRCRHGAGVLFTDGVTEARTDGELFGAGRLTHALAELGPTADASSYYSAWPKRPIQL